MASRHESIYKGSEEVDFKDCDVCKYQNISSEAVSLCGICGEYLCDSCAKAHRGSRLTRDHRLLTGNDMLSAALPKPALSAMFCEDHKSMHLTLYCKSHDEIICGTCKITNHKKCHIFDVCQVGSKGKKGMPFNRAIQQLMDLENSFKDLKQTNQVNKDRIKSELKECFKKVGQIRKEINVMLDKLEKHLTENIKDKEKSLTTEIVTHGTLLDNVLGQIGIQIKSLSECLKSDDDIAMFVGKRKASYLQNRYEEMISSLEKEMCPVKIQFEPDVALTNMLVELKSLGALIIEREKKSFKEVYDSPVHDILSVLSNTTFTPGKNFDLVVRHINDCVFMPNGYFVAACGIDGLRLFNEDFCLINLLHGLFYGVQAISPTEIITTRGDTTLFCAQICNNIGIKVRRKIMAVRPCYGVDVFGSTIFVTCHDEPGNGEVRVLNMDGTLQQKLEIIEGEYLFSCPQVVKVYKDGNRLFISDTGTNIVTCLNRQGSVIYKYSHKELNSPLGIYVDRKANILVFGKDSGDVHVVQKDGTQDSILTLSGYGITDPQCIAYRHNTGLFVMSQKTAHLYIVHVTD